MTHATPFTISIKDLTVFSPERAVEFFRQLLWAEAARVGIGKNLINVPDCINVGDGGIDAIIRDAKPSNDELIPIGTTGFQMKSSDLEPKECKKELHQKGELNQPLKPEIKRILDESGNYVLVLFADISEQKKNRREKAIKDELKSLGYKNSIRIYIANQIAGFAETFISIVNWLKGNQVECLPYSSWQERHDIASPKKFVYDSIRKSYIDEIRDKVRNPDGKAQVFRVIGLPGIGKTRLVFEALSQDDLKNFTVYIPTASKFISSSLYFELQNNSNKSAILVIDECDMHQHEELVRCFSNKGERISVISISNEDENLSRPTVKYILNPLGEKEIEEIIKSEEEKLPLSAVHRLAEFSGGYPRIAVLLLESYLATGSPQDEFFGINDDALMNRLIGGRFDENSADFKKIKKVLTGISLFKKVGYKGELSGEAEWVAKTMGVEWEDFNDIVYEQKKRGIIQGEYFIYVTPFILKINLLVEWWDRQDFMKDKFNEFLGSIPENFRQDMFRRFLDHVPFITTTEKGKEFVKEILSSDGIYSDESMLENQLGTDFFLKLSEADPDSAIACLNRTIGKWDKDRLLNYTTGRREIVWSLERIAMWRELFPDAARLLLALGEAENENIGNNASGVFADLFSPAYGQLAPTEASLQERLPILEEALDSDSKEGRLLALEAASHALESMHFSRTVGAEYQGLRKEPKLWMPKTYGEIWDAYVKVWQLLNHRLGNLSEDENRQISNIFLNKTRGLLRIPKISVMVLDTIEEIISKNYIDNKIILAEIIRILHYDSKNQKKEILDRLQKIKEKLTGNDFPSLLKRYVGMRLLEDRIDENGKSVDITKLKIEELAETALKNKKPLKFQLTWLVSQEAENGPIFGYEIGKRDGGHSLLNDILEAQRDAGEKSSVGFLGGYFRSIFEKDKQRWEKELDNVMNDYKLRILLSDLIWHSGISDQAAMRILALAEKGILDAKNFKVFAFGGVIQKLSENILNKWINYLLSCSDTYATDIALELFHFYYIYRKSQISLPEELTFKLVTHKSLFLDCKKEKLDQMSKHHWTEIGMKFIEAYPNRGLEIAKVMLESFGSDDSIIGKFFSTTHSVLNEIARKYPSEVWRIVRKYLVIPIDSRAFAIESWLHGGEYYHLKEGALSLFPLVLIWKWVDEDIEKRAWFIADIAPKELFREKGKICFAREVLVRYGDREDVRNELMANFSSEGWSGSAVLHYQEKKEKLLDFKKEELDKNVTLWIDEYVSYLDSSIEREKIREERRGF